MISNAWLHIQRQGQVSIQGKQAQLILSELKLYHGLKIFLLHVDKQEVIRGQEDYQRFGQTVRGM